MSYNKFSALADVIKSKYPKFQYKFKDQDNFMSFLGRVMFFNKGFMTAYTTTIGPTVYFPEKAEFEAHPDSFFETLCHEYVHVADDAKHPIWFKLKYLFPQILALPAFLFIVLSPILITLMALSIISPLWLLTLLSLVFLVPIPSPGRTQAELRGYGMSLKVRMWEGVITNDATTYVNRYITAFTGSGYWYMCPFRGYIIRELDKYFKTDDCLNEETFKDVYNLIKA